MILNKNKSLLYVVLSIFLILSNSLNGQKVVSIVGKRSVYEQKVYGSYLYFTFSLIFLIYLSHLKIIIYI